MTGKHHLDWFKTLDEGAREKAIANFHLQNPNDLKTYPLDMFNALSGAFHWCDTPEGHDYWAEVTARYLPHETDLPKTDT